MSKRLKVFTLNLSKWLRANSANFVKADEQSRLYHQSSRTYCCLGMFGRQCGVPLAAMRGLGDPSEVNDRVGDFGQLVNVRGNTTALAQKAMHINDDVDTDDAFKIAALRPVFREWGYKMVIVP